MKTSAGKVKNFGLLMWIVAIAFILIYVFTAADLDFQSDSEDYAIGPIYAVTEGVSLDTGHFGLGRLKFKNDGYVKKNVYISIVENGVSFKNKYTYKQYRSQIGLQGFVYQKVTKVLSGFLNFKMIRYGFKVCCMVLFLLVVFLIILQLKKRYGFIFASVFGLVTLLSPWTQNFSVNIYWVEFTWFIPILLELLVLNHYKKRFLLYPLFFVAIFVKCLCGYEYLSTIMAASIMFFIAEWFVHKEERWKLFRSVLVIGILSVAAFATVYLIHAYYNGFGDIGLGLRYMWSDLVRHRTYGEADMYIGVTKDSLNASVLVVLWKYIGFGNINGIFNLMLSVLVVISLAYRKKVQKIDVKLETVLFVSSLLAALSWIVLAKSHSYVHTHINFAMFYLGWAQVSFYIIFVTLKDKFGFEVKRKTV